LYELLTGRLPIAGATAREVLQQLASGEIAPPSSLNTEVTPQVEAVCLRCLRNNPWRRYHRVYDVLIRLRYLIDDPNGRAAPGPWWLNRRPPQRDSK
jgi:eukaryotic-like serine/threonine-protein kinase